MRRTALAVLVIVFPTICGAMQLELPADVAFQKASMLLVDMGALPTFRDKELLVIRTDPMPVSLTPAQADCGKMFGIPYLKDKRTHVTAAYQIVIKPLEENLSDVAVKVTLEGYMAETEGAPFFVEKTRNRDKVLMCTSSGWLESEFLDKLQSVP